MPSTTAPSQCGTRGSWIGGRPRRAEQSANPLACQPLDAMASEMISRPTIRILIPGIVAVLHFLLCVAIATGIIRAEGSWAWFIVFFIDFPISIVLLKLGNFVPLVISFGILGSIWWYLVILILVVVLQKLIGKLRGN
jgi:hypothetical protein